MADNHNQAQAIFGKNTELYFSFLSGLFLAIGFSLDTWTNLEPYIHLICYIISYGFGGYFITQEAIRKIGKGLFEIDSLMIVAAIGAAYIGSWAEGSLLLFLFSLGHALEHYAMNKAEKSIKALGNLSAKTALLKNGNSLKEIPIEDLEIGNIIVVQPHTKIAADGVIIKGISSINQAPITGESMPVDKSQFPKDQEIPKFSDIDKSHIVFSGTINGDSALEVRVLKLTKDSTVSRLISLVNDVETQKSPTQRRTKKFEKIYVPIVILLVTVLCFAFLVIDEPFETSLYRAITVLVAASPCALAISTPSAVLSGIARAAQRGVLIKGGRALEDLGSVTTIAFDKTGTLTEGKPSLKHVVAFNDFDKKELLQLLYEVERLSNHPLAKAIAKAIKEQEQLEAANLASNISAIQGKGIEALYKNEPVYIGNTRLMTDQKFTIPEAVETQFNQQLEAGETVMLVGYQNQIIGLVSVMDVPRKTAANTLLRLKKIGIKNMIMLTGDHESVGKAIAKQIGLTESRGNLLPEDKVDAMRLLIERDGKVAMVGDGVNDAPAMALSTVSIAMGAAGSDVALETADVALMSDKLEMLPFAIGLSRASKRIINQNIFISLGVVAILVPVTILGLTNIGLAVLFHEGSTVVVVINALRLLAYKED
ncbi:MULTISPECIES: heavy metal translocating P-type ATPase [Bizionia]|uniref:P-type Zn(2+) transporter n=1 Tax=Bizionia algoritergicola TaxID=291187 RepID=A0A5D0QZZ0_9FLAO|nr:MULTISPECIES: heavy metal translocating P-type ATPase [Bizionia]OBX21801.1 ATPase [Bizionia sp. APA-3]TYB74853.1 heavy metal translocating P-type ATPase [Bizionia algoritergicola]